MKIYVIVDCDVLMNQWECDADRRPIAVLVNPDGKDLERFQCDGYEIYVALENGALKKIQGYDDYYQETEEID